MNGLGAPPRIYGSRTCRFELEVSCRVGPTRRGRLFVVIRPIRPEVRQGDRFAPPYLRLNAAAGTWSVQLSKALAWSRSSIIPAFCVGRHPSRCCVSALDAGMSIPAKNPSQPK